MGKKTVSKSYPWGHEEWVHILNQAFMEGGLAYNERKGFKRVFTGSCNHKSWELAMYEGVKALEALSNQSTTKE